MPVWLTNTQWRRKICFKKLWVRNAPIFSPATLLCFFSTLLSLSFGASFNGFFVYHFLSFLQSFTDSDSFLSLLKDLFLVSHVPSTPLQFAPCLSLFLFLFPNLLIGATANLKLLAEGRTWLCSIDELFTDRKICKSLDFIICTMPLETVLRFISV